MSRPVPLQPSSLHILSIVIIFAGFALLSKAWHVLYHAQRRHQIATNGPYRLVRPPQYIGFVAIMFGFLLQWPTLLTLAMFPVLVIMYIRLSIAEEQDSARTFWASLAGLRRLDAAFHSKLFQGQRRRSSRGGQPLERSPFGFHVRITSTRSFTRPLR